MVFPKTRRGGFCPGCHICIAVLLLGLCIVDTSAETGDIDAQVRAFGVETSKLYHTAFVFVDGRYLEPPYCVARKGFAVFINDQMVIEPLKEWPVRDLTVTEDPPVPSNLTSMSKFIDISQSPTDDPYDAPMHKKARYVRHRLPGEDGVKAMVLWFESLPFVASVEQLDPNQISVLTKSGERRVFWIDTRPDQAPSDSEVILEANLHRRAIERILETGYCCFFLSHGEQILVRNDRARDVLSQIIEIAQKTNSSKQKIAELGNIGFDSPTSDAELSELVDTFVVTPQLHKRLSSSTNQRTGEHTSGER